MENYFIIHGSFGSPFGNWFSWLHDFIESEGKQVYVPDFPVGVGYQNYENWSKLLKYYLDLRLINENTTIIGHSIAPVFISKFLVENKVKVKKVIFVCGFNNYLGINKEYDAVNKSMDLGQVFRHILYLQNQYFLHLNYIIKLLICQYFLIFLYQKIQLLSSWIFWFSGSYYLMQV